MMMVAAWLVTSVVIGLVLTLGAAAWERAAGWSGRAARWGWLAALGGSVVLPWMLGLLPGGSWVDTMPGAMTLPRMDVLMAGGAGTASGPGALEVGVAVWALMSAAALSYVALTMGQLARARRRWRSAELDGTRVLVAPAAGPAAVGFLRSSVVVPSWVLDLDRELRSLLLKHERAHVEAGDPRLLLAGLLLVAAMPWNPAVWIQLLRLRNAIELDCDARVLSTGVDPQRYGSLLLEVGRRRSANAFVMATFAEPRLFLEQRIRRIARWPVERRPVRAALFTMGALALFAGALSCDPVRVANTSDNGPAVPAVDGSDVLETSATSSEPEPTPMTQRPELLNGDEVQRSLVRLYPPLLRDAGIGGEPTINLFIDTTGVVTRTMIGRSSGYPALDAAALEIAGTMKFSPALKDNRRVGVWIEIPIRMRSTDAPPPGDAARTATRERASAASDRTGPEARLPDADGPVHTPMTERPELLNRDEVEQVLADNYPPLLRNAGIGGSPTVYFHIGRDGTVQRTLLAEESGHPALDAAALRVAAAMRFSPARNNGELVPVWVEIPIVFTP